tara:strand:- start:1011 stop:1235 length:225 start_codon:yes stop_codon:yes gene_type:complete
MREKQLLISDVDPEDLNFIQAYTIIKQLAPLLRRKLVTGGDFSVELFLLLEIIDNQSIPEVIDYFPEGIFSAEA